MQDIVLIRDAERSAFVAHATSKEYLMSTTQNNDRDSTVEEELNKLPDRTTTSEYFDRALGLGASPVLLERIGTHYLGYDSRDRYQVASLPYVDKLLGAGWSTAQVREFLHHMCFGDHDTSGYHRDGFWNDSSAWHVFGTDQFVAFMKQFAATYEGHRRILTESGHDTLATYLSQRDDVQQNQRDLRAIEAVAASHLIFIDNEYTLGQMIRYAVPRNHKDQAAMAYHVPVWGWGLVFRGWVLAKLPSLSYEHDLVTQEIYRRLEREPGQAVQTYRWLMEGFWREHNEYWMLRVEHSHIQNAFTSRGWHFTQVEEGRHGVLQVTLPSKKGKGGLPTIVRHVPDGEELKAGDEVMVHRDQLKDLKVGFQPGGQVYYLTISPARRPTAEMLADVHGQFPSLVSRQRQSKSA